MESMQLSTGMFMKTTKLKLSPFSVKWSKVRRCANVLYEIFNEPLQVSWTDNLVPYHTAVINAIRQYDTPTSFVGTPTWSQDVMWPPEPYSNQTNIAYTRTTMLALTCRICATRPRLLLTTALPSL
uniref:Glycoside hydrolase family 5 domain-containing protein n=1 Tax=Ditylenchus dipsaci TaxID=166011 RepID=A0A915EGM6_9BILA